MDASSYLKRHGWRGDGHSLDHTGRGIRKPLLVSKKVDVLGVGLNKHAAVSDQWWMRAYDQGLKDLGTGKTSALSNVRENGMAYGGLYGRFVKGEGVAGTFEQKSEEKESRKRKRGETGEEDVETEKRVKTNVSSQEKALNRNVRRFVDEAVRQGLMSEDAKEAVKKDSSSGAVSKYGEKAVAKVFKAAGLSEGSKSVEEDKYAQGKRRRALKHAAREYLMAQMSSEERKIMKEIKSRPKGNSTLSAPVDAVDKSKKGDEKATAKEAKALRKREKRERKIMERDGFENNADEIKIAPVSKSKSKTVPGVGVVERYPTKAEKRAKKLGVQKENTTPELVADETTASSETDSSTIVPGFTVDTEGDMALKGQDSMAESLSVIDSDGNVRYTCMPDQAVPLDPTIWLGIKPKLLPAPVRRARALHMRQKREARQARKAKKER